MPETDNLKRLTVRIEPGTHKELKVLCAKQGWSVNAAIVGLIERLLRGSAKLENRHGQ